MPDALQIARVYVGDGLPDELFLARWAPIDASSAGDNEILALVAGRKIRVIGIKFSVADAVVLTWKSNATALGAAETYKAGGGMSDYWGPHGCFFETGVGEALNLGLSGAVQVSGWLNYILI
jgi:hypothetical protein